MTYPIEIIDDLSGKYLNIKKEARIDKEFLDDKLEIEIQKMSTEHNNYFKKFNLNNKEDLLKIIENRNTILNTLYQKLSQLEETLKNPDLEKVKSALESISYLNKEILNSSCPSLKNKSNLNEFLETGEHEWNTPMCFDSGYTINGKEYDYFSSYTICKSCENFIVKL